MYEADSKHSDRILIKPDCMEQFRTEYAEGKYDKNPGIKMEAAVENILLI